MSECLWKMNFEPSTLESIEKTHENIYNDLLKFVEASNMPHLLFSGPQGCGKLTTAKLFARKILENPQNIFIADAKDPITSEEKALAEKMSRVSKSSMSASAGTTKTIRPFIQVRVLPYVKAKPFGNDPFSIFIVNHFDELGIEQEAFRRIIERYSRHCRVILLSSRLSRVIDPIVSRTRIMSFSNISIDVFGDIVGDMLDTFDASYDQEEIEYIYNIVDGNMKKGIDLCQYTYEIHDNIEKKNVKDAYYQIFGTFQYKILGIFQNITTQATNIAINGMEQLIKSEYFQWSDFVTQLTKIAWKYCDVTDRNAFIKKLAELDAMNKDHMDIRPNLYDLVYELIEVYKKLYGL